MRLTVLVGFKNYKKFKKINISPVGLLSTIIKCQEANFYDHNCGKIPIPVE